MVRMIKRDHHVRLRLVRRDLPQAGEIQQPESTDFGAHLDLVVGDTVMFCERQELWSELVESIAHLSCLDRKLAHCDSACSSVAFKIGKEGISLTWTPHASTPLGDPSCHPGLFSKLDKLVLVMVLVLLDPVVSKHLYLRFAAPNFRIRLPLGMTVLPFDSLFIRHPTDSSAGLSKGLE
ncbi:uncharacterized protein JCM15063_003033 [Sporobolomyces koalae]|uniref:uncharacterized protein n=1 Tax=Sporobolomyces koalae TaxID=500713 RepID=UPI00317811AF